MLQVTSLLNSVGPAVISLGRGARRGSGVVVAEGRVVVMSHSLVGADVMVDVTNERREGTVVGSDRRAGISLLAVPTDGVTPMVWAEETPAIGDIVFALGDPGTGLRITEGRVSASPLSLRGRSGHLLEGIEHTAPLPRGSGGGPLVDGEGAVVGLNALRTDPGLLFAIGSAVIRPAVERLLAGGPEPARLGIAIAPPRISRGLRRAVGLPDRDGLLVRDVEPDSPAGRAGVQRGDLVVALGAAEVTSVDSLFAALEASAGASTPLRLVRGADELELTVALSGTDT